ncbi:MAG: aminotransferase class I/II-fold pyridoxal phosphate-dependent enzyme [Gemmatimonadetes bacterium]|nr:aminotransferase class I/II-fold pyridoxal phosphate-dependent enzyme [Gemmatimonadota bacterium]
MNRFPREAYRDLGVYDPGRTPVAVDLSDNTNRWGAHPQALAALRQCAEESVTRYPSTYADGLKQAIARRFGIDVAAITTGCGSDDILDCTLRAVCDPGAKVTYHDPTFFMIEVFSRVNGIQPVAVPTNSALTARAMLAADPAMVYVCRPNNPTGTLLSRQLVEELLEDEEGPIVLVDEAYIDFADPGESFLHQAPTHSRLVVARTLSKLYGLAGLRVGFAVAAPATVHEIDKSRGPYKVSAPAEAAAIAAIAADDGWFERVVAEVIENRARLGERLQALSFEPLPSHANFVLIPTPQGARAIASALRGQGVGVRPFPGLPGIGDAIRVTIGPWALLERFLDALASVVD